MNAVPQEAAACLDSWLGREWTAQALAGDASVRAYYRVTSPRGRFVLTWYPEEVHSQCARFLAAHRTIAPYVRVPRVLEHSDVAVLQEDAGNTTLFDALHEDRDEGLRLYRVAVDMLASLHHAGDPGLISPFTAPYFLNEMAMAREFYVEKLMRADGSGLGPWMEKIADTVSRHPYVLCHRDYHGQNMHVLNRELLLIDFQDIRMGPDTYDMASLLRDRGVASIIGDRTELELLELYASKCGATGDVRTRYFETLLQRSIKILGTFAKMPIVRGKMNYLNFIPPTIESIRRCLDELPQFAPLRDMLPLAFLPEAARKRARELNDLN